MFVTASAPIGMLGLRDDSSLPDGIGFEFEQMAAVGCQQRPSVKVRDSDNATPDRNWLTGSSVRDVSVIGMTTVGPVFSFRWADRPPRLFERVHAANGDILAANAEEDTWRFQLRFPNERAASEFYRADGALARELNILSVSGDFDDESSRLGTPSEKQQAALKLAFELGYFEVPRRTTLEDVAHQLGISDTALSQRLRRGMNQLLTQTFNPVSATS